MYSNFDSRRESRDGRDYRDREDRRRPEPYRRDSREASRYGSGTRREEPRRDDRHRQPERQPEPEYRERRRSISPLSKRKRKLDNWDLSPVGYEGMSVAQVKLTGHFPLPGQPPRPDSKTLTYIHHNFAPGVVTKTNLPVAFLPHLARNTRRIFVGNLPPNIIESEVLSFINGSMQKLSNDPTLKKEYCILAQLEPEKNIGFIEFKTDDDATSALQLNGFKFKDHVLKVKRPKDYHLPQGMLPGMVSANVTDSVNKIFVGDIPINLTEDQIMELLKAFGELRAFSLIKDPSTGISKGFAFCEYLDVQLTDIVCEGLNGMELAGKNLIVNRATPENNALLGELGPSVILPNSIYSGGGAQSDPSCVLLMMNIVAFEDLSDNTEYKDILEDIENECRRYGDVEKVVLPRPSELSDFRSVGKAYVKYTQKDDCSKALRAFAGRKFDGRVVVTSFYSEEAFDKGSLV